MGTYRAGKITARNRQSRALCEECWLFAMPESRPPLHHIGKRRQPVNSAEAIPPIFGSWLSDESGSRASKGPPILSTGTFGPAKAGVRHSARPPRNCEQHLTGRGCAPGPVRHQQLAAFIPRKDCSCGSLLSQPSWVVIAYSVSTVKSRLCSCAWERSGRSNCLVVCASPRYLSEHAIPEVPQDLTRHNCIRMIRWGQVFDRWCFVVDGVQQEVVVSGALTANGADVVHSWVLAGRGIGIKASWDIQTDLEDGRLVELLAPYSHDQMNLYAVYASRNHLPQL